MGDALLGVCLSRGFGLRRKLEDRCLLTVTQRCQENNLPVRKFECIVMHPQLVLVDLTKDGGRVAYCLVTPPNEAGWCT
jgi:hypothetical protein